MDGAEIQCQGCAEFFRVPAGWLTYRGPWRCPECGARHRVMTSSKGNVTGITLTEKYVVAPFTCPAPVKRDLAEAVLAFQVGALRATVVMLRRALEQACVLKGAAGSSLAAKIRDLHRAQALLDAHTVAAAESLRLLGNYGAHPESDLLDDLGAPEVKRALDLAVDLLREMFRRRRPTP